MSKAEVGQGGSDVRYLALFEQFGIVELFRQGVEVVERGRMGPARGAVVERGEKLVRLVEQVRGDGRRTGRLVQLELRGQLHRLHSPLVGLTGKRKKNDLIAP